MTIDAASDLNAADLRDRAVIAARGDAGFDVLIRGGRVADVMTGEMRPADIGVVGPMIASVHAAGARPDASDIVEADGLLVTPGLIDSHMHVESSMVTPQTYAAHMLPRGVTTLVWDPHEFANVAGVAGLDYAAAQARAAVARILPLVPSCVPSAPGYETAGADFGPDLIETLLARADTVGLAEVMDMASVISRAPRMRGIVQAALVSGKLVCGHARGLSGAALQAFLAAGIGSDHELTSADDLMEKLRAGLTIELRGSHDHLLPEIAARLAALPQCPPSLTLCTDDTFPDDLHAAGGLDDMMRRMIRYGLQPMRALQAATYNAAQRLGRSDLGLIAPGRRADLVLTPDLAAFAPERVMFNGAFEATAGGGGGAVDLPAPVWRELSPKDFAIPAKGPVARIATIDQPRFTQWGERRVAVRNGRATLPKDGVWMSVTHRHGPAPATPSNGVLTGWGAWDGAFATTVSHDSHNLTVFGGNHADMAIAANALVACGGGMAVAQRGALLAVAPLPIAGLVSDQPLERVAQDFSAVRAAMDKVVDWRPPYLVFKALVGATLACNKGPHLTDLGIADALDGRLLPTPVLEDGLV